MKSPKKVPLAEKQLLAYSPIDSFLPLFIHSFPSGQYSSTDRRTAVLLQDKCIDQLLCQADRLLPWHLQALTVNLLMLSTGYLSRSHRTCKVSSVFLATL